MKSNYIALLKEESYLVMLIESLKLNGEDSSKVESIKEKVHEERMKIKKRLELKAC